MNVCAWINSHFWTAMALAVLISFAAWWWWCVLLCWAFSGFNNAFSGLTRGKS